MRWYFLNVVLIVLCFKFGVARNVKEFHGYKLPCSNTSPECLKESLQVVVSRFIQGIPELGIPSLDPFQVDKLILELPGQVKIEFTDAYTKGLQKCTVDYVRKVTEEHIELQFECNLFSKGNYRSSGHLFMFSIDGEGQSTIICKNLKVSCSFDLKNKTKEDGKIYMEIDNFKTSHKYDGRVIYNMTNLFKGNPNMSKLVLEFMNRNWRMVANEFGGPIVEFGINAVLDNVKKLLDTVPLDELMIV